MTSPEPLAATDPASIRLTTLTHGGGCGCKIAPRVLREALAGVSGGFPHPDLLVGSATADDAAVFRLNDRQALVATTDFFMPIVDDPRDFGRIAATNAISDVYAMGAMPVLALAILGMPVNTLPLDVIRRIMEGGAEVCREAGIALAGGHSIDSPEPIYGLAVIGLATPSGIKRNDTAQAGDALVLGKPLGVGVLSAALKKGLLDAAGYAELLRVTTQLNTVGQRLGAFEAVHAMTDVTGFGLLGHLLEICRGSGLAARVRFNSLPVLSTALVLTPQGIGPGAIERNWASYGDEVRLSSGLPAWAQRLLCDPQTSGGLLVACAPGAVTAILECFHAAGFLEATAIGTLESGDPQVIVA
ncbi:MAG: selenide, water dikinase SelD [Candidatus Contendobacter sp.]|nr:selenide, water dikinase SelD [Candidatus Contendobacter sp.]MDG4556499.1 selenide, water dikinase SelD [Candidatus Contendobacter sp.]